MIRSQQKCIAEKKHQKTLSVVLHWDNWVLKTKRREVNLLVSFFIPNFAEILHKTILYRIMIVAAFPKIRIQNNEAFPREVNRKKKPMNTVQAWHENEITFGDEFASTIKRFLHGLLAFKHLLFIVPFAQNIVRHCTEEKIILAFGCRCVKAKLPTKPIHCVKINSPSEFKRIPQRPNGNINSNIVNGFIVLNCSIF